MSANLCSFVSDNLTQCNEHSTWFHPLTGWAWCERHAASALSQGHKLIPMDVKRAAYPRCHVFMREILSFKPSMVTRPASAG